jgi:hypothetical protein
MSTLLQLFDVQHFLNGLAVDVVHVVVPPQAPTTDVAGEPVHVV